MPHKDPEERRTYSRLYDRLPERKRLIGQRLAERRKKYNVGTLNRKRQGKRWTEQDIASLWDTRCTTKELAVLLHRSFHAVRQARSHFSSKQPSSYRHNGNCRIEIPEIAKEK